MDGIISEPEQIVYDLYCPSTLGISRSIKMNIDQYVSFLFEGSHVAVHQVTKDTIEDVIDEMCLEHELAREDDQDDS